MKLTRRPSMLSAITLAAFGLVALASAAEAQPLPFERGRPLPGAYAPVYAPVYAPTLRHGRFGRLPRVVMQQAPVVIVQPAPRPVAPVVVTPAPCHPAVVAPPAPPPPADEHGILVLDSTPLVGGQAVRISWGASYYAGQVVAVNGNGTVRVHYSNYDGMWDEDVARYRLRLPR